MNKVECWCWLDLLDPGKLPPLSMIILCLFVWKGQGGHTVGVWRIIRANANTWIKKMCRRSIFQEISRIHIIISLTGSGSQQLCPSGPHPNAVKQLFVPHTSPGRHSSSEPQSPCPKSHILFNAQQEEAVDGLYSLQRASFEPFLVKRQTVKIIRKR